MEFHKAPFQLSELKLEVTHKCPLACIHCSSDAIPSCDREMDHDKSLKIIKEAIEMGVNEIAFSGGEPLLWPHIEEVIKLAATKISKIVLYTSGNVKNVETAFRSLKDKGLSKVILSLFGPEEKSHQFITRTANSFNLTKDAIICARKIGLDTEIHFVALARNYKSLPDIASLVKTLDVSRISILRFVPQGRGTLLRNDELTKLQNLELKKIIETLRKEGFSIRTGSPYNFLMVNDKADCFSGIDRLIIGPTLRLFPCDAFKNINAEDVVGSANLSTLEQATLKQCWQHSPYLNEVRKYLTTDFGEPCKICKSITKCVSGCLAQKVLVHGKFVKGPDPMCLINQVG